VAELLDIIDELTGNVTHPGQCQERYTAPGNNLSCQETAGHQGPLHRDEAARLLWTVSEDGELRVYPAGGAS
jgi:hypothetical protein